MNASKILFAAATLALAACGQDDRSSVYVQGRAASASDTECTYAPGGEFQLGFGVLDVGPDYNAFLRYQLPLYLRNDMEQPVGSGQSVSGNDFVVENVRVAVNPGDYVREYRPNPPLLDFTAVGGAPASASVPHSGPPVEAGGESATVIEAIPSDLGFVIQQAVAAAGGGLHTIVLGISIEGRTNDGTEISVPDYFYPIHVCQGCLPRATTCVAPQVETFVGCGYPGQDVAPVCAEPAAL